MKLAIYLAGRSPTGGPWSFTVPAADQHACTNAVSMLHRLSNGATIMLAQVEVPDHLIVQVEPAVSVVLDATTELVVVQP